VTLYSHSTDIPGRSDTLGAAHFAKGSTVDPMRLLKKLRQGVRFATTTTATVFGNVASEIAGRYGHLCFWVYSHISINLSVFPSSSVLQPNSPQAIIKTSLESANKSRLVCTNSYLLRTSCGISPNASVSV
jgi:hypothetical protein